MTAQLRDEKPLGSGQVGVLLSTGDRLVLRDDGRWPDEQAGDGVFTGAFRAPEVTGMQPLELRVEARGRRAGSETFARLATAAVMVTKPAGGLASEGVEVSPEAFKVSLLPAQGRFRVELLFVANGMTFAWAQEGVQLAGQGREVSVPRPPESLGAELAVVRLLNLDTLGVEAEREVPLVLLAAAPDFRVMRQKAQPLPPSKAEAARRFGDNP